MTSPMPTYRTTLGVAKETVYGTAVAATAFFPISSFTPHDKIVELVDNGWRGSAVDVYGHVQGPVTSELDFGGDVFADTIGWPIVGVLGDDTVTGASAPYSHAITLLNTGSTQPPSYTLTENTAINAKQFAGCKFSEVAFKFDGAGKLTYTAKATGLQSVVASAPTISFSSVPITAAWAGLAKIGGTAVQLVSGEWTIKRPVEPINTVDGTQAPLVNWSGPASASGKLTVVMLADTYRANYIAGAATSIEAIFTQGAGAALTKVDLLCSKATLTDAQETFGKSYIELDLTFDCEANTTDIGASAGYGITAVTLQNALPTATYK